MTPPGLLVGQFLIVFATVLLGLWTATQWAAAMLACQPPLGLLWFSRFAAFVQRVGQQPASGRLTLLPEEPC